jgi:signal transduction histidine kinase
VLYLDGTSVWEHRDTEVRRCGARRPAAVASFAATEPGVAAFLATGRRLSRDEVDESLRWRPVRADLQRLFDALGASLLVPFLRGGRTGGFIAVGAKLSTAPLSADDVDVLETLANQTGLALATAAAVGQVQAAHEQLRRSEQLAALGELAAAVAHGIRNPLSGIRLAAQLGLEATKGVPVHENFDDIMVEVNKLEGQVRGILDFVRPFEPNREPVALRELVHSVLRTMAARLGEKHITVASDVPAELPPVSADRQHLTQLLQELIVNACEAVPEAGRLTITATSEAVNASPPMVRLVVADNGPGIPPDQRERVFRLFATTKATGTGVGLAVVRKIIERHGGTIVVEDAVPSGAAFVIRLPIATAA